MSRRDAPRHPFPALPAHGAGQAIGLFGGSFNPPHEGHLHVSRFALTRLQLDALWWLVTPGNPLKSRGELAPLEKRVAAAQALAGHPRIRVTSVEADIGHARTRDTLRYLKRRCAGVRFVWIMGADNLAGFHHWHAWTEIAQLVPIAVIDRPGWTLPALASRAAIRLGRFRLDADDAPALARRIPPAWVFLHGPRSTASSTALRANADN